MKYCAKCGMLLEDNHEVCIGCGAEVVEEGTYTLFPPHIEETVIRQKAEEKKRGGMIIALIAVFCLLVGSIVGFIIFNMTNMTDESERPVLAMNEDEEDAADEELTEDATDVEDEEAESELTDTLDADLVSDAPESEESEETAPNEPVNKVVKDDQGRYYYVGTLEDSAGNTVFRTIYPEDFKPVASQVKNSEYSTKFPESLTYIVANDDNNAKFTYMSPRHYWHRDSKKGKSRYNERNVKDYMSYLTYAKAEGYIEALIKQSYTDIKGFKLTGTRAVDDGMVEFLSEFSASHSQTLAGISGDYAHIGDDTSYAAMQADYEANIFSYQATTRQNNTIYMDFYVPVIANTLSYASTKENDMGDVIEWFPLAVIAFEAGNEELYNMYKDAYDAFIFNSRLTKEFFYDNEKYASEIKAAVADSKTPDELTDVKLASYHNDYNDNIELSSFYDGVYNFLNKAPDAYINYSGSGSGGGDLAGDGDSGGGDSSGGGSAGGGISVLCKPDTRTAYYNSESGKVFLSPDANEYPGEPYVELQGDKPAEPQENSSESPDETQDSGADSDSGSDSDSSDSDSSDEENPPAGSGLA